MGSSDKNADCSDEFSIRQWRSRLKNLQQELFKIERYVEMVLTYIRLDSISSDYVITKINLDEVVKDSVKKYATIITLTKK